LDPYRNERVSESLREELGELISYELSDPRIGLVTVTEVLLSPDIRRANVRLALTGTPQEQAASLAAINHAKQFIKVQLSERLQLHHMPEFHFEADLPPELAVKAPQILKRIRRGRPKS
jgi:ribosome-binding factor A